MMARQALVLGVGASLGFAAGTVLAGFLRHNPGFAGDVLLFHDGLSDRDLNAMQRMGARVLPVTLGADRIGQRLRDAGLADDAQGALKRRHPMILAKLAMLDWLDRYDTLLWCDADVLIRAPLDDLWQAGPLTWRPLPTAAFGRRRSVLPEGFDPATAPPLPNAGIVVVQAEVRHRYGLDAAATFAEAAAVLNRGHAASPDELALHAAAMRRGIPVQALDQGFNHPVDQPGGDQAAILHAIGPDKFWNAAPLRQGHPQWQADHAQWLAAGGSPAPEPDRLLAVHPPDPAQALVFARNRAFWQSVWPDLGPLVPRGLWPDLRSERPFLRLFLTGDADRTMWIDLGRTAHPLRLGLTLALDRRRLTDPDLSDRLAVALEAVQRPALTRKDGRRLTEWAGAAPVDAVPDALQALQAALVQARIG